MKRALLVWLALASSAIGARAAAVPAPCGPQALGTSRTLVVGTKGGPEIGLESYPRTLALADHEVALTFDDGPGATTPAVLAALAAQCVKATFFLIGRNAEAMPAIVRREVAEGHTVGHHTWSHPAVTLRRMSPGAAEAEIERGFKADDLAAYGEAGETPRVPFFRFPGFADSPVTDQWLARHDVAVFGTDVWALDWLPMRPRTELDILMRRLEARGRGIVLLHDTRKSTAAMLPDLLRTLKARHYRIVALVSGPGIAETVPAAAGWSSETDRVISSVFARQASLSARRASKFARRVSHSKRPATAIPESRRDPPARVVLGISTRFTLYIQPRAGLFPFGFNASRGRS